MVVGDGTLQDERLRAFWGFITERQHIFALRREGHAAPWTDDPVLNAHRFTNVYRASDRVSQYAIRHVLYEGPDEPSETAFRAVLFRVFNQPGTFARLRRTLGRSPDLANFGPARYHQILLDFARDGGKVWNNAYMITPPLVTYGTGEGGKIRGWLDIVEMMREGGAFAGIASAPSLESVYRILLAYPTVGPFFAMQWTIDINYSTAVDFSENEFIMPGPGALRGAAKLAGAVLSLRATQALIRHLTDAQDAYFARYGLAFAYLGGARRLHLIDVQNCLCEFDKWTRVARPEWGGGGKYFNRIKQSYNPTLAQHHAPIAYFYPPKWGITEGVS